MIDPRALTSLRRFPQTRRTLARLLAGGIVAGAGFASGCSAGDDPRVGNEPLDPSLAEVALVDRFSEQAGAIHVRTDDNGLPGPGEPVDFDAAFLFDGLGPRGGRMQYYDFDVKSQEPGRLYSFYEGDVAVEGQLPVLSHLPGQPGYNDLVEEMRVLVPRGYRANSLVSEAAIVESGVLVEPTRRIANRPVVSDGSTASVRHRGDEGTLRYAWHDGRLAPYFALEDEVPVQSGPLGGTAVGISSIWVAFNVNPDQPGGGPPSGVMREAGTTQSHNVAETLPGETRYSPLWMVVMYDNAAFDAVRDLPSAEAAPVVPGVPSPLVNCPIVSVGP